MAKDTVFGGLAGKAEKGLKGRAKQIEAAVSDHKEHYAKQHPKMVKDEAKKKASKSIQDWIESGR